MVAAVSRSDFCRSGVAASTEQVSYSGVTVEDAEGNILTGEDVSYTKVNGYADHFPVVVSFEFTRSH